MVRGPKAHTTLFLAALLGIGFLGISLYFFGLSTESERETSVSQYDDLSLKWTETYRPQLADVGYFWYTSPQEENGVKLPAVTTGDPLSDWGDDILTYTPLRFEKKGLFANVTNTDNADNTDNFSIVLLASNASERLSGHSEWLDRLHVTLALTRVHKYASVKKTCVFQGGAWKQGRCAQSQYASSVCFVLPVDAGGKWLPGVPLKGCYRGKGDAAFARYHVAALRSVQKNTLLESTVLTLRSPYDPYLLAAELTHDSMSFGMTQGQKMGLGVLFLILGLFALTLPIGRFCLSLRAKKARGEETQMVKHRARDSEDFGGVGFEPAGDDGFDDEDSTFEDELEGDGGIKLDLGASLRG